MVLFFFEVATLCIIYYRLSQPMVKFCLNNTLNWGYLYTKILEEIFSTMTSLQLSNYYIFRVNPLRSITSHGVGCICIRRKMGEWSIRIHCKMDEWSIHIRCKMGEWSIRICCKMWILLCQHSLRMLLTPSDDVCSCRPGCVPALVSGLWLDRPLVSSELVRRS